MRPSYFNSIVPYDDKFVLYNSFSNRFLLLADQLKDLFVENKRTIDQLQNIHPDFYTALQNGMFIVDNDRQEVEEVKRISKKIDLDESAYKLTINPTMNCNFKCWYCYETHVKKSRMDVEIIQRTSAFISSIVSSGTLKLFNLSWFGGEPLLYYHDIVLPIMQHTNAECKKYGVRCTIGFTTNGFLINQPMVDDFKSLNVHGVQITLDGHGTDHDAVRYVSSTRGSYAEIIDNIKLLAKNGVPVTMRINYTLANINKCGLIVHDLLDLTPDQRKVVLVDFHRVWQDKANDQEEMILQQVKTFRNFGFNVNSHYLPNNVIHSCYADKKNSATINYNGDLFKCTARDFTTIKREGYINETGELIWENDSMNIRLNAKFNNPPCLRCRILPLCNGGCSQHAIEHTGEEYCVYSFDESEKDKIIIAKFEEAIA